MRIGFIDLTIDHPFIYLFQKKGSDYRFLDTIPFSVDREYTISIESIPEGMDRFYLSLPIDLLNFRIIKMPFSDQEKILTTLPYELEDIIAKPVDSIVFDCIIDRNREYTSHGEARDHSILVAYIEKNMLKSILTDLDTLNMEPSVVTSLDLRYRLDHFSIDKVLEHVELSEKERRKLCIEEITTPTLNLRKGEFAHNKEIDKAKKWIKIGGIISAMILLTLTAYGGLKFHWINKRIHSYKSHMKEDYKKVFKNEKRVVSPLYQIKSHIKTIKDKQAFFYGISPLELVSDISSINNPNIIFNEVEINADMMKIKGDAQNMIDVERVQNELQKRFSDVRVIETRTSSDKRVVFSLTISLKRL